MSMNIADTASVAEQPCLYCPNYGSPFYNRLVAVVIRITDAATVGSLNVIFRWEDPVLGTVSHTVTILLTVLNNYKSEVFPVTLVGNVNYDPVGTIECVAVGLVGTTAFVIDVATQGLG
jgi:hypothetical protein